jgi:hypothetical protein
MQMFSSRPIWHGHDRNVCDVLDDIGDDARFVVCADLDDDGVEWYSIFDTYTGDTVLQRLASRRRADQFCVQRNDKHATRVRRNLNV